MRVFYKSKLAKWMLWQGYSTITLGCFVFTKKSKAEMKTRVLNHEAIHVRQLTLVMSVTGFNVWMYLLCPLWFYLQYGLEYAVSRVYHSFKGIHEADGNKISYGNSAFEMEAKSNEEIDRYLDVRRPFEFARYYGKI